MDRKEQFDRNYLLMCKAWADNSRAVRLKVGALLVKDNQIISDGFNGTARGLDNNCEFWRDGSLVTKPDVIHAEMNAILKIATRGGMGCNGATLYVTDSPCYQCAVFILQCGISRVVYDREYRITDGIDFLRDNGVEVVHLPLVDFECL